MKNCVLVCVVLLFAVVCCAGAKYGAWETEKGVLRSKRGIFECKALNHACSGVINCCGNLQCFWEDGYSMIKDGVCVSCVQQGKRCQRDTQCCPGYVCQKGGAGFVDGLCNNKRTRGHDCHENDQCQSGTCTRTAGEVMSFKDGKCE